MVSSSPPPAANTLSPPATLLYRLGLPVTTGALYTLSPSTALFVPLVAAPTFYLLRRRSKEPAASRPGDLETLIWAFVGASTVGPAVVMAAQGALSYSTALLAFGDQTNEYIAEFTRSANEVPPLPLETVQRRAVMARSWRYIAYLIVFSFSMAGLPEEVMKYGILTLIKRRYGKAANKMTAREYVLYATTIGLGFSFFENLAYIYASASDTTKMLLITAAERVIYGTAAHMLTAVLTASYMVKRDLQGEQLSCWQILGPSTLYHGAGDAILIAACALDGHVGWYHPQTVGKFAQYVAPLLVSMVGLAVHVARNLRAIGVSGIFL